MRAAVACAILLAGCGGTSRCKPNTLLLSLSFSSALASATSVEVTVSVDGNGTHVTTLPLRAGMSSGTVEVDFSPSYPVGHTANVVVDALVDGQVVGSASSDVPLAAGCSAAALSLTAGAQGVDMSMATDGGSGADLAHSGPPCGNAGWKCVFVSSQVYGGNLGGLSGADAKCSALAVTRSLGGTFKAWLSDSTNSPSNRFTMSPVPYRLVDGTVIASDWSHLIGATATAPLQHAIDEDESGAAGPVATDDCGHNHAVWTSTDRNGVTFTTDCNHWVSPSSLVFGVAGDSSLATGGWTDSCSSTKCSGSAALYCFEQ